MVSSKGYQCINRSMDGCGHVLLDGLQNGKANAYPNQCWKCREAHTTTGLMCHSHHFMLIPSHADTPRQQK
jgi:hypothetical protein